MTWEIADPPLGENMNGQVKAVVNLGSLHQEVGLSESDPIYHQQFYIQELLKSDRSLNRNDCVDKGKWYVVKQYGYYNGFGGNARPVFDPITMEILSSHVFEHDPIGGHDRFKLIPSVFNIENKTGRQTHTFVLEHPWDGTEGGKMKISVEVVAGVGFGENEIYVPDVEQPIVSNVNTNGNSVSSGQVATSTTTTQSEITPLNNGFIRMQNKWKKSNYIHNQSGTLEDGQIQPNWWSAQWKIVPVQGGWVRIQNKWKPDQYLHNQNGKIEVGKTHPNWWSAQWKIVPVQGGWVRIQNKWKPDQYLHNQNGQIEVGKIQPGWWSAQWKLE